MSIETRIAFEILRLTAQESLSEWDKAQVSAFYTAHPEMLED